MVSVEIGVTGPGEELGDMSVALPGGPGQGSCVQSSSEPLHRQTVGYISVDAFLGRRIFPLLCFHAPSQGENVNGCELHIQIAQIRSSSWGSG